MDTDKKIYHSQRARTKKSQWLSIPGVVLFFGVCLAIHFYHEPIPLTPWIIIAVLCLGMLLGVAHNLIRNYEWGSYFTGDAFVYWHGPTPAERHVIPIASIQQILLKSRSEGFDDIVLKTTDNRNIPVSTQCIPKGSIVFWKEEVRKSYPTLNIETVSIG